MEYVWECFFALVFMALGAYVESLHTPKLRDLVAEKIAEQTIASKLKDNPVNPVDPVKKT